MLFPAVRCVFHDETTSNIYIGPRRRPDTDPSSTEGLSLEWVDVMAEVIHPGENDGPLREAFIATFKAPLNKVQADYAYQLARRYCQLNVDHVRKQAEAIRDELASRL
jgi:hypothetical protein